MDNWFQSKMRSFWRRRELTGVVLKWSIVTSIISTFVAIVVLGIRYQNFGEDCLMTESAVSTFGITVAVLSSLVPLVIVVTSKISWGRKALISLMLVIIFAVFWWWKLVPRDDLCTSAAIGWQLLNAQTSH